MLKILKTRKMKIILAFLTLVIYCTADDELFRGRELIFMKDERSVTGSLIAAIESIREQMPCGFPEQGIPPLAPLNLTYQNVLLNGTDIYVKGSVSDFLLNGLNEFVIDKFKVNIVTSKITYRLLFKNVNMKTMYDLQAELNKYGFAVQLQGVGLAKYALKNVEVWGSIKYSYNIISGHTRVKGLEVRIKIGHAESEVDGLMVNGKFNEKLNEILAEFGPKLINENQEIIMKTIETYGLPLINKQLEGGSSNGNDGTTEKPKCNPNEFF